MPASSSAAAVFVGAATLDAIALVDHFPHPDERQVADEVAYAGGGPAATAAVAASRLGVPSALIGAVGADAEGEQILSSLRDEGVDVSGIQVLPGRRSGASVVVVDAQQGTRAICTRPVPPLTIPSTGRAAELVTQAPWLHVDHLGWQPVQARMESVDAASRPRISVDAGNPIPGFSADGVDLYVPTDGSLARRYGELPIEDLLTAALDEGANTVVATRGSAGSIAATRDGLRYQAPGHRVEVVSTLGAGDVFHGALLAAVVKGMGLKSSLHYANATAALSCRGLDGRSAIPTHAEVLTALHAIDGVTTSSRPN